MKSACRLGLLTFLAVAGLALAAVGAPRPASWAAWVKNPLTQPVTVILTNVYAASNSTITVKLGDAERTFQGLGCLETTNFSFVANLKLRREDRLTITGSNLLWGQFVLKHTPTWKPLSGKGRQSVPDAYYLLRDRILLERDETTSFSNTNTTCSWLQKAWTVELTERKPANWRLDDGSNDPGPAAGDGRWALLGPGRSADKRIMSLDWSASLGRLMDGTAAGRLTLREAQLLPETYTPTNLYFTAASEVVRDEMELITQTATSPVLRQVKAYQAFVDIVPLSNATEMRFYQPSQVGTATNSLGHYTSFTGSPYVVWAVINPEPSTTNKLHIVERRSGVSLTNDLAFNPASSTDTWVLRTGSGAAQRVEKRGVVVTGGAETNRTETVDVRYQGAGTAAYQAVEKYRLFPWGFELVETRTDPDASPGTANDLVTTFEFHTDPAEVHSYGKLKWIAYPDGNWEKRLYDDDDPWLYGSLRYVLRPDGSGPATPGLADFDNSIVSHYEYDLETLAPENVRHYYRTLPGSNPFRYEKHGRWGFGGESAPRTGASFDGVAASQGGTWFVGRYAETFNETTGFGYAGHDNYVQDGDGPVQFLYVKGGTYNPGTRTFASGTDPVAVGPDFKKSIIHTGTADENGGSSGVELFPFTDVEGELLDQWSGAPVEFRRHQTTRESHVYHKGSLVLRELDVFAADAGGVPVFERLATWRYDNDSLGHATNVVLVDAATGAQRTVYQADYKGTNSFDGELLLWEVDETGVKTVYAYDVLKRRTTTTREGVAAAGGLPAQPDLVTTTVYDAQDRVLSESSASAGLTLTASRTYDLAGRVLSATDQNGLSRSYAYELGGRRVTETLPTAATVVTENYLDRRLYSVTGTGAVAEHHFWNHIGDEQEEGRAFMETDVFYEHVIRTGSSNSPRWRSEAFEWAGRTNRFEEPEFGGGTNSFVTKLEFTALKGTKLSAVKDTRATIYNIPRESYLHDFDGETSVTSVTADGSSYGYAPAHTPRMTRRDAFYGKIGGHWFHCITNWQYRTEGSDVATLVSVEQRRVSGFTSGTTLSEVRHHDADTNLTVVTLTVDRAAKRTTEVTDTPQSTLNATNVFVLGLLQSSNTDSVAQPVRFAYDGLGRQVAVTNAVGAVSTTTYVSGKDQVSSTRDFTALETAYDYYSNGQTGAGQLKSRTVAGKATRYAYTARGELWRVWGDVPYPEERVYDSYGDLTQLKTYRAGTGWNGAAWPASPGTADVTTWTYDPASGHLAAKTDAKNRIVNYTWWQGLLQTRTWARGGTVMTNLYNDLGELVGADYSDAATTDWAYTNATSVLRFSRTGLPLFMRDASGDWTLKYDHADRLVSAACTAGLLNGVTVSNRFDKVFGRNLLRITGSPSGALETGYGYDTYGRHGSVTNGSSLVSYAYLPGTDLPQTTTFRHSSTDVLASRRAWDFGVRLRDIENGVVGGGVVSAHRYAFDAWNRRIRATLEDGSAWAYDYNDRSEVLAGRRVWADQSPVAGQQFQYGYDTLGNRTQNVAGGDGQGGGLRTNAWTADELNQYTQRAVGTVRDVVGVASPLAAVTVNGAAADERKGEYFWKALSVANASAPAWTAFTVTATQGGSAGTAGNLLTPPATESFTYDHDGNLTQDGLWDYTWDGENRLTKVESRSTLLPLTARRRVELAYDQMGRRVQKKIWTHNGSTFQLAQNLVFVHDGWRLVAELEATTKNVVRSYAWGPDLSGTLDQAGGVGGLVVVNAGGQAHYPAYDGNGNVTGLVQQDKSVSARYEHGPFGEPVRQTGTLAAANPFRWSTKYWDAETDLVYYGYRYYSPSLGRWVGRDPVGERGGLNLYAFVANRPAQSVDALGEFGFTTDLQASMAERASMMETAMVTAKQGALIIGRVQSAIEIFNMVQETAYRLSDGEADSDDLEFLLAMGGQIVADKLTGKAIGSAQDLFGKTAAKLGIDAAKGGTYKLRDPETGQVRRTGKTNDLDRRQTEHARGKETKDLDFEIDRRTGNEAARRGREQRIYDQHPEADLNKRRPISPDNPKRDYYLDEGDKLQ